MGAWRKGSRVFELGEAARLGCWEVGAEKNLLGSSPCEDRPKLAGAAPGVGGPEGYDVGVRI